MFFKALYHAALSRATELGWDATQGCLLIVRFLLPAGVAPARHKTIETTDIMLQMVAGGRGVAALPRWLVQEYAARMDVVPVRLGPRGIAKQIHLGARVADLQTDYLQAFIALARSMSAQKAINLEAIQT